MPAIPISFNRNFRMVTQQLWISSCSLPGLQVMIQTADMQMDSEIRISTQNGAFMVQLHGRLVCVPALKCLRANMALDCQTTKPRHMQYWLQRLTQRLSS